MERIEISSVLKGIVWNHYPMDIDWRLIDAEGTHPVPNEYVRPSYITKDQFTTIMLAEFGCSEPTIRNKWKILVAREYLREFSKSKAYIMLPNIKGEIPEYASRKFNESLYAMNEEKKEKKNTPSEAIE